MKRFKIYIEKTTEYVIEVEADRLIDAWRISDAMVKEKLVGVDGTETVFSVSDVQEIKQVRHPEAV